MKSFVASDGTTVYFDSLPTLKAVTELFNFVYEEEVNNHVRVTIEGSRAIPNPNSARAAAWPWFCDICKTEFDDRRWAEECTHGREGDIARTSPLDAAGGGAAAGGASDDSVPYRYTD